MSTELCRGFPSLLTMVWLEIWRFYAAVPCQRANKYTGAHSLDMGRCQRGPQEPVDGVRWPHPSICLSLQQEQGCRVCIYFVPKKMLLKGQWERVKESQDLANHYYQGVASIAINKCKYIKHITPSPVKELPKTPRWVRRTSLVLADLAQRCSIAVWMS